uniref:Transmembrane protein 107 n=1 Tax=Spongospora subterranea TaxID=70186 RepID=A0A0H5R730_9EUKA|eukprot:CRZ09557.1 hypothetical protein [Spongospora subterranea]
MGIETTLLPSRFLLTTLHFMVVTMLFNSKGNNLRAGLSLTFTIDQYRQVESEFDAAIWICIACFIIEYIALFSGVSIMKNAQNGFLSCLHLLGTVLLSWFILDSWHYKSFWYLVVCCSMIPAILESIVIMTTFLGGNLQYS